MNAGRSGPYSQRGAKKHVWHIEQRTGHENAPVTAGTSQDYCGTLSPENEGFGFIRQQVPANSLPASWAGVEVRQLKAEFQPSQASETSAGPVLCIRPI